MKYLKLLLTFLLYFIILTATILAQDEAEIDDVIPNEMVIREFNFPTKEPVKVFQPFDYPNQHKDLGNDTDLQPGRLNNWIVSGLIALAILVLIVFLIIRAKSIWLRLGIGFGGLLLLLPLGYIFIILDVYATMAPPTAMGKAMERLTNLSKSLSVEWLDLRHPKDDGYRLGIVRSKEGAIIVDYDKNKGWLIPKEQVAALVAHPDDTFEKDAQAVELFTEASEQNETPIQYLVFVLKNGNNPSQIWIRHKDDFYQYDAIAMIEDFILAWEQQAE